MELAANCIRTIPLEWKHFSVVMRQKQGLKRRGAEPSPPHKLNVQSTKLTTTSLVNQDVEPNAGTSHPGVLGSPEMHRNPKPALRLLWKLQITPVFTGVLIKLVTTDSSQLIPFLHRTHHAMNFRGDTRIKRPTFFQVIFFPNTQNRTDIPTVISGYSFLTSKECSSRDSNLIIIVISGQ